MALAKSATKTADELRKSLNKQVVAIYRKFCRDAPRIIIMYNLENTPAEIRHMVMLHFRKNNHVTDPRIVELFLQRAKMEHEETMNQWKQRGHILELLQPELSAPDPWVDEEEYFRRFLDGTLVPENIWLNHDQRKIDARLLKIHQTEALEAAGEGSNNTNGEHEEHLRIQNLLQRLVSEESAPVGTSTTSTKVRLQ